MILCDSGWHRISTFLCQPLHCVRSDPVGYCCTCPLLKVPMLLHYYYLMSRIYMSRMSTSPDLDKIFLKQEAGRRTSKKPSVCHSSHQKPILTTLTSPMAGWLLLLLPIIPSGWQIQDPHASLVFFLAEPKASYFSK